MAKSEQEQTTDIIPAITEIKEIKSLIYVVRGQQVEVLHSKWLKCELPIKIATTL